MMNAQELFLSLLSEGYDLSKATLAYNLSVSSIRNYTRATGDIETLFPNEVVSLALYIYNQNDSRHIKSMTQGSRSITFIEDIPADIKNSLPRYVRGY